MQADGSSVPAGSPERAAEAMPEPLHPAGPAQGTRWPTAAVFAPSPLLTVTIEHGADGAEEIHLHAGGQGFWIARMLVLLGVHAQLCAPFGGEVGQVLRTLIAEEHIALPGNVSTRGNGAYVHDRRGDQRVPVADMAPVPLTRHELDDLYSTTLASAATADVTILGGPATRQVVPPDVYRRLAADLRSLGKVVIADLSGEELASALRGGVTVLKASHEELIADGRARNGDLPTLASSMRELAASGADHVVLSRGGEGPDLALIDGRPVQVLGPHMQSVDHRGAGDSMTAGLAAALSRGHTLETALRLGAAAGASNATRKGLGTGKRQLIEELAELIDIQPLAIAAPDEAGAPFGNPAGQETFRR